MRLRVAGLRLIFLQTAPLAKPLLHSAGNDVAQQRGRDDLNEQLAMFLPIRARGRDQEAARVVSAATRAVIQTPNHRYIDVSG